MTSTVHKPPRVKVVASRYLDSSNKENERRTSNITKDSKNTTTHPTLLSLKRLSLPTSRTPLSSLPPSQRSQGSNIISSSTNAKSITAADKASPTVASTPLVRSIHPIPPSDAMASQTATNDCSTGGQPCRSQSVVLASEDSLASLAIPLASAALPCSSAFPTSLSSLPPVQQEWIYFAHSTVWLQSLFLLQSIEFAHLHRRRSAERQLWALQRSIQSKSLELSSHRRALTDLHRRIDQHLQLSTQYHLTCRTSPSLQTSFTHHHLLSAFIDRRMREVRLEGLRLTDQAEVEAELKAIKGLTEAVADLLSCDSSAAPSLLRLKSVVSAVVGLVREDREELDKVEGILRDLQGKGEMEGSVRMQEMDEAMEVKREAKRKEEGQWDWGQCEVTHTRSFTE